jgi:putative DNA primase/helicase
MGVQLPPNSTLDISEIAQLADQGMTFIGCRMGMSSSRWEGWQQRATNNKLTLLDWLKDGYSLVTVAKRGHSFVVDVDDLGACEAAGFEQEWLDGYYAVDTPSGGTHHHGLHDFTTEGLGNLVVVYRVKGDKSSGKILELKLHNQSVAAPTAERFADEKKCAGVYKPQVPGSKMKRGVNPELLAWITVNGETPRIYEDAEETRTDFHPSFKMEDFLECNDCSKNKSGIVGGVLHVVTDDCPICGKEARKSTLAAGITKFIFAGQRYGFICHACGVNSRVEFEETMQETLADWQPWDGYIYRDDDPLLLIGDPTFAAEQAADDEEAVPNSGTPGGGKDDEQFTYEDQDTGNGERLVKKFGHLIRWISETNEWMVWGKKGWRKNNGGELMRMTKAVLKDLTKDACEGNKPDPQKVKHAIYSGRLERRKAMIASAGYEKGVFTNINDWDSNGWLGNYENGVIDLRTQTFRERTPDDLCMKQSPVRFDIDTKCPLWESALNKYMCGDESLIEYLQVAWGATLTSDTSLQSLFFNQGDGENGKDTAFSVISYILGSYCQNVNFMTFAETRNHSEHRNDLASLAGAVRMVTSCESSDGHSLDEGVIKQVTGCSPVTCRQILGKPFTYIPQYKMWFMSNYEPLIKGNDWGIWRRVKKIPWNYTIRAEEKDPNFAEKLKAEAPGILNWLLEGLKKYIQLGYKLPDCKAVEDATAQYRKDMDIIGRFVGERLTFQPTATALGLTIYKSYDEWCKENGTLPLSSRRFYGEFKKRYTGKIKWRDVNKGVKFEGVGIPDDGHHMTDDMF